MIIVNHQVHRRELEEDGVVVDPLKAKYTMKVCVLYVGYYKGYVFTICAWFTGIYQDI